MRVIPIQLIRVFIGILGLLFAFALGRTVVRLRRANQPLTRALTWVLRTAVTLMAVLWFGGFDLTGIIFSVLTVAAFAAGAYFEVRPHHEEEIHLFPDQR